MSYNNSNNTSFLKKIPVVGIGASAGGLEAFKIFFEKMPVNTGMAFVMVPHLDPGHKSMMVEIMGRYTKMPVLQVEDRMKIEPDHVYIVSPNRNLTVEEGELVPSEISRSRGINLPVDIFFRSLAVAQKERAIGIILSGTMRDGAMGLKDIKEHGGLVIAQSPDTAQHDGMPQSAIETGMVDLVLPIEDMPEAIIKFIAHPYIHGEVRPEDQDELNQVLAVIRAKTGHDFRHYKRNTLVRRTERRMGLRQIEVMADYVTILKNNPDETDALLKDLLIGVTGFFREEQVWDKVRTDILPFMIKNMDPDTPIRVWIPGCSTGEEAYTIAILIHDAFEKANKHFNAQIFATDIDGEAIITARKGAYPETIAANIPREYLKKYFSYEDGEYYILRRVRESVVFAEQNLMGDAPFSNLNLISCRNLLIYLSPDIQKKIIEMFHFALLEDGCLVLGNSETIGYHHELFETVSKENRIYRRIGQRPERMQIPIMGYSTRFHGLTSSTQMEISPKDMSKLMHSQLLKRFAPAAVLIDKSCEILNLYGPTTQYLNLPEGNPVMEITSMVKEGLRLKLRAAIHKAAKNNGTITVSDARVKRERRFYPVQFTVSPIKEKEMQNRLFLVTFQDHSTQQPETEKPEEPYFGDENLVQQLEAELLDTREDLQNTIEELETSNEELKASNEEMMSMNEELQSSNEELETSKEELQSMNEELNTVNAELREKVHELEGANNDIANLMNSTEVATVFLDVNMSIRRFTPAARNLFNLIPSDVGRPIGDLAMRFNDSDLQHDADEVMDTLIPSAREVLTDKNNWYIRRVLPFRTQDKRVDGLVLTFSDITEIKEKEIALSESEAQLKEREAQYRLLVQNANSAIIRWTVDGTVTFFNEYAREFFGYKADEILGKNVSILLPEEDSTGTDLTGLVSEIITNPAKFINNVNENIRSDGRRVWMAWTNKPIFDENGNFKEILAVGSDITALKDAEMALMKSESEKSLILDNADELIAYHDRDNNLVWANRAYLKATGKTLSQLKGIKCFQCWDLKELCGGCPVTRAIETGKPQRGELSPDNQAHWAEDQGSWDVRSAPVRDENGNIIGAIEIARDITEQKKSDKKLLLSEKLYRTVGESIPYGIWQSDASGRCTYVSDAFLEMTGMTLKQIQDFGWLHLLPEEDRESTREHWMHCVQTGEGFEREHRFQAKDGSTNYVLAIGRPVRDEQGDITSWVGVNLDINDRKEAEEALRTLSQFPAENPNPVIRCTEEGNTLYVNSPAQLWLESLGWKSEELLPASIRDLVKAAWEKTRPMETEITNPASRIFSIIAVRPSGEEYINLYGVDITDRKKAEAALKKANEVLESKVMERTAELEWRNRELQEFAYVASHDLQEPLRKIKLFGEMAEKELKKALTEQGQDYLRRMNRAADRMQKLVKSLLSYSRSSSKTSPFERVALKPIVELIVKDLLPEDEGLSPVIEVDDLPEIDADPVQMHQLFQNILANAIHYHKKGQTPKVKISSRILEWNGKHKERVCELIVEDNGIGFDMAYVDKIFLPFERLHEHDKYEGTGMGLAICRKIAERHGGKIEARSKPGEGTLFIVTLPVRQINETE